MGRGSVTTIELIERHQLVVVVRTETPERAYEAARAAIKGGVRLVEITFSVPQAEEVIARLRKDHGNTIPGASSPEVKPPVGPKIPPLNPLLAKEGTGEVIIGAGTVLGIQDARKAIKAGAAYVVSPHVDEEIIRFVKMESAALVSIPGASTPTEILNAHRAGGDIIKLFPFVEMGGLSFLKTIRGPLPFIKYMPSGGVTLENVGDYLKARVTGIIVGSAIMKPELLGAGDWTGIEGLAREFVKKVQRLTG